MPLRDDLLTPIAGANPGGAALRYDPIYDKIKEARREDPDLPQGEWQTTRKTAEWPQVIQLASEALATRSKDLQLAAWLTEALLRREGFSGLRQGLELVRAMVEQFWDHLYPELEDGDAELRAAPLQWVGIALDIPVKFVPLSPNGHNYLHYRESRAVPTEADAEASSERRTQRERAIAEGKLTPEQFDQGVNATPTEWYQALVADLDGSLEALAALDDMGEEKFGDEAPSYLKLRQALQDIRQVAGQLLARRLKAEPETSIASPAASSAESAVDAGNPGGGGDPSPASSGFAPDSSSAAVSSSSPGGETPALPATDRPALSSIAISPVPGSRGEAAARIAAAARFLRAQAPTDPAAYLLLRGFRWGELRARGSSVDPRLLEAPPTEIRTRLKTLLLDENWQELLEGAEEIMATPYGRGWLDLQRHVLTACDRLGSEYDYVAAAIRGALRSLLQELPQLSELTLMDDTPTANAETCAWLQAEVIFGENSPAAVESRETMEEPYGNGRGRSQRGPLERATEMVRAGQSEKAIELLMREAAQERSQRARFLRRSQAARIMVDTGLEAVAMPILREMLQQIERHNLEEWEAGETIGQPLGLLYRCIQKLEGQTAEKETLYLRICRLDPLQAMHFTTATENGESGG
ncbi:MAG: type VI secretion system protein TssA [Gemmatimonadetes bacterium]|nr:type VI secretion system protein TssA [Gemmatimonadota bacterium]